MFNISSNQVIKIHKGDDSSEFPLLLNQGTAKEPIQFKIYPAFSVIEVPEQLDISIIESTFVSKIPADGFHDFEWNYKYTPQGQVIAGPGWLYNNELINIAEYGITVAGIPKIADHIIVAQWKKDEHITEVYFYIIEDHCDLDQYLMKKTFKSTGKTITHFNIPRVEIDDIVVTRPTVDPSNNMLLSLDSKVTTGTIGDTDPLMSGEYQYQIRANLYDYYEDKHKINTVTSRLPIYIIDSEDGKIW